MQILNGSGDALVAFAIVAAAMTGFSSHVPVPGITSDVIGAAEGTVLDGHEPPVDTALPRGF
jgi:hypothetical protein